MSRNHTPRKFIHSLSVLDSSFRWNDILCEGKGRWTRLWVSSHGTSQEEISLEEDELHHRPAKAQAECDICGGISYESPSYRRK